MYLTRGIVRRGISRFDYFGVFGYLVTTAHLFMSSV